MIFLGLRPKLCSQNGRFHDQCTGIFTNLILMLLLDSDFVCKSCFHFILLPNFSVIVENQPIPKV